MTKKKSKEEREKPSKKKMLLKRILKKGQMTVKIPEFKAPSILGDPNKFFKDEFEREKRRTFI